MSIADQIHEEGREQGRKEGLKKGRQEGLQRGLKRGHERGVKQGVKQGHEQGVKQGHEQGVKQGRIAALRSLFLLKFHSLNATDEARLQTATSDALDRYLQRVLTADSASRVFED